jgi:hypothetical protein
MLGYPTSTKIMGVIKRGILGGFANKVANVVGTSWKGIAVIKSLPLSVANPRTAGQIQQRTNMTNVVLFAKAILSTIIKPLNDRFAQRMSGYNLFVQRNIDLFPDTTPFPSAELIIAEGTLVGNEDLTIASSAAAHTVTADWTNNTGEGDALGSDVNYILVYNSTRNQFETSIITARNLGEVVIPVSNDWVAGDTLYMYAAFRRTDGTRVSNTSYVTMAMGA